MVMWPPVTITMKVPCQLFHINLAALIVTAEVLNGTTSNKAVPATAFVQVCGLQDLYHVFCSTLGITKALISQIYDWIIHRQPSLLAMVQLMAACSMIQGLRSWRRRSNTQQDDSLTRRMKSLDHKATESHTLFNFGATSPSG